MTAARRDATDDRAWACGLYLPGHDVHWIQGLHSGRDDENPPEQGRLLGASEDGTLRVQVDGEVRRLWNHDPGRLARLVARNKGVVTHQPRWGLLRTKSAQGAYCFCVVNATKDHEPCPHKAPEGNLLELLKQAGGATLSIREIKQWLEEEAPRP